MTSPGTMTNNSIRQHSVLIGGAGPIGHRVHQVAGGERSRSGGDGLTGLVGIAGSGGDPIPAPNARNSG